MWVKNVVAFVYRDVDYHCVHNVKVMAILLDWLMQTMNLNFNDHEGEGGGVWFYVSISLCFPVFFSVFVCVWLKNKHVETFSLHRVRVGVYVWYAINILCV